MALVEPPADVDSSPASAARSALAGVPEPAVQPGRSRYLWLWLTCLVCGLAAPPGHSQLRTTAVASGPFEPLGLSARAEKGKLLLTWNVGSEAVKKARRAVLSITDGDRKEEVDLSLRLFHAGALVYEPVTEDVTLQLRVSADGAVDTIEAVRADVPEDGMAVAPAAPRYPRLFAPPASAPPSPSIPEVAEPPVMEVEVRPALGTIEPAQGLTASAPPPAAPRPAVKHDPVPAPAQATAGPLRVASLTVLRRTVIPYPPYARQAHLGGTVRVEVRIGADGHVRQAVAISGPELLRVAANGVRDWLFEPPVVDGKQVEAITRVDVTFTPRKQ